jgi:hypothetical protein
LTAEAGKGVACSEKEFPFRSISGTFGADLVESPITLGRDVAGEFTVDVLATA